MFTSYAYRVCRVDNNEFLFGGIVSNMYVNIHPAHELRHLDHEFPNLPQEVEVKDFEVEGLYLEMREFSITWQQVLDNPA